MNIIVIVPPPVEPVSLTEIKQFLRLDGDAHPDDDMLSGMISAARDEAEQITRRSFVEQTLRITANQFPAYSASLTAFQPYFSGGIWYHRRFIELLRPPLAQVLSVKYYDSTGALQTVDTSNYYVTDDLVPRLMFNDVFSCPELQLRDDAIRVDYITGYPVEDSNDMVSNIPQLIKNAIKIGVQLMYDQIAVDQRAALEQQKKSLLSGYKVWTF